MNLIIDIEGTKIKWFETFFKYNTNKLGVHLSGGIDSSLLLWMLCKFTTDLNKFDLKIYPCHARDFDDRTKNTTTITKQIIKVISEQFPKVAIQELTVGIFNSHKDSRKVTWAKNPENKLRNEYGVDWIIDARNMNISEQEALELGIDITAFPWTNQRDQKRDPHRILTGIDTFEDVQKISPFFNCNKIVIKKLYERYGLIDTILPLTYSCIETAGKFPCEKCHWCIEKKAVFGVY
jgi:7-cyano-7-deazaguanine synthase in queuosine biosynthesis